MTNDQYPEEEIYATLVEINQEPIELYKVLKIGNLVFAGGEAKQVIAEGYVYVNGEMETRKRKKIYAGDLVSFNDQYLQVALKGQLADYELVEEPAHQPEPEKQATSLKKKRKPIQF